MGISSSQLPLALRHRLGLAAKPAPRRVTRIRGIFRNKWEAEYADHLEFLMRAGEIEAWWYEPWKFELGPKRIITPDFLVEFHDGRKEWHETKGYCWDRDRVRMDWLIAIHPDLPLFIVSKRRGGGWSKKRWTMPTPA